MTKTIDALVEALEPVATWMEQSANCSSGGPDHPPEPTSQFDYELLQAASEIRAALAQARAEQAEPVAWRAWFDADHGARWLFTLWPQEERLDVDWQPLYTAPPAAPVAKLEPWQPIETAPKDGRHVLIANDTPGSIHPCEGYYVTPEHRYGKEPKHAGWWRLAGSSEASVHGRTPTHWMPLPPPPVAAHNAKLGGAG